MTPRVAIVHDYLTQRGGAERVVLAMMRAFPEATLHTSLYDPDRTFPEFKQYTVQTMPINAVRFFRRHHRAALPFLAPSFSAYRVDADVVICSSSGWAHGVRTNGRKLVYCHTPARWLYQRGLYIGARRRRSPRAATKRLAIAVLARPLRHWDRRAAHSAAVYMVNSTAVRDRVKHAYGLDAALLPPPHAELTRLATQPIAGVVPGYLLCVSRLLPYKNVDVLLEAMQQVPERHLVIAGSGPEMSRLAAVAPANVQLLGEVSDGQLAWLYENCWALVAPSHEDFGLAPLEAADFGKPTVALAWGGYLDTIARGRTGFFFDQATPDCIATSLELLRTTPVDVAAIREHARRFDEGHYVEGLRQFVGAGRG